MTTNVTQIKGLWEVLSSSGTMLVRAKSRRDASEVAVNVLYQGHPECARVRETLDNQTGYYHVTYDVVNWGMAETQVVLTVRRPDVFV